MVVLAFQAFAEPSVPSATLDAFANRDGSVTLANLVEIVNPQNAAPLTSFTVSLPSSNLKMNRIEAYRCELTTGMQLERGTVALPAEMEGRKKNLLSVKNHPDPQLDTEIVVDFGEHPVMPGESATLCVDAVVPDYISRDFVCPDSAYISVRPTLYYGNDNQDSELFMNIHLPEGIPASAVLGQQEWPQNQIKLSLPINEEEGHAVVRWHDKAPLDEIYWIAAIFPSTGFKTKKAFDGLQTDIRLIPKETLQMDAYIQNDSRMRVNYQIEIENTSGCKPVNSVQFILTGKPDSMSAQYLDRPIRIASAPDILDSVEQYIGRSWYQGVNAELGSAPILPQKSGTLTLKTVQTGRIDLLDPNAGTVSVTLCPVASASGHWQPGSKWITQIHLPIGVSADEVEAISSGATKDVQDGVVVVRWEQTTQPSPVTCGFPIGNLQDVNWTSEPNDILYVLKHPGKFPKTRNALLTFLAPVGLLIAIGIVRRAFKKR